MYVCVYIYIYICTYLCLGNFTSQDVDADHSRDSGLTGPAAIQHRAGVRAGHTILYYTIRFYTTTILLLLLYYTMLYYTITNYPTLYYAILHYTMLCYTILCTAPGRTPGARVLGLPAGKKGRSAPESGGRFRGNRPSTNTTCLTRVFFNGGVANGDDP